MMVSEECREGKQFGQLEHRADPVIDGGKGGWNSLVQLGLKTR